MRTLLKKILLLKLKYIVRHCLEDVPDQGLGPETVQDGPCLDLHLFDHGLVQDQVQFHDQGTIFSVQSFLSNAVLYN